MKISDLKTFEEVLHEHRQDPEFKKEWDHYMDLKEKILAAIDDLISDFLYYDRKEDEDLPRGSIEEALSNGIITVEEIVAEFRSCLSKYIEEK